MIKLRSACELRRNQSLKLFKIELYDVAQSIATNSEALYHNNKSDILKKSHHLRNMIFKKCSSSYRHFPYFKGIIYYELQYI